MLEKALTPSEWQKLSRSRDLQDAALLKALAAFEQADDDPTARLRALDDIGRQASLLRKSVRDDRQILNLLDDMEKAVERQRRQARKDASAASAGPEQDGTPALLTSKMQPLLRDIRKGGVMQALIATNGKTAVVLLSRRAIGPSRRRLLADALGQAAGVRYIPGECLFEQKALTFVVTTEVSGLARKLRAALLEQTGLRLKVRVRGDDPTLVDTDGDDEETAATPPPATAAAATAPLIAQLRSRLLALGPRIRQAAASPAEKAAIFGLVTQLQQSLQRGEGEQSQALLKSLAQRLVEAGTSAGAPVRIVSMVRLQQARLQWETTRATLRQRLRLLETKTLAFFADRPEFSRAQAAVGRLDEVMAALDEDLIDTLDDALNESDPARRLDIQAEALLCVEDYADFVRSSALVADLDANPFTPVDIRETVLRSAGQLHAALG